MEWVNQLVEFTSNYPDMADFITYLSYLIGFLMFGWTVKLFVDAYVFRAIPVTDLGPMKITLLLALASMILSLGNTVAGVGNTLFNYDTGYNLADFMSYEELQLQAALNTQKVLREFSLVSMSLLGRFFSLWGLINIYMGLAPQKGQKDSGSIFAGITRVVVGVIFIKPREFFNLFGTYGDQIFGP